MMLKLRNTILMSIMMLVQRISSEETQKLLPCYSVHKIKTDNSTHHYQFVDSYVTLPGESEGPPGSKLQLQLFDVVQQRPGFVSTSQGNDNCSLGSVQIYNLTTNGALVLAQKVCSSFMAGPVIVTDTNVAVLTTVAQSQFDLHVTVLPQNTQSMLQAKNTQDMDRTHSVLDYEQELFNERLDKPQQKQAPLLFQKPSENIKNLSIPAFKIKASHNANKEQNEMPKAAEKANAASQYPLDDSIKYAEYDYEYESDQEDSSETEGKIPLEKLFDLRENSKYSKINNLKRTANKRPQFVHKTKQ